MPGRTFFAEFGQQLVKWRGIRVAAVRTCCRVEPGFGAKPGKHVERSLLRRAPVTKDQSDQQRTKVVAVVESWRR